MYNWSTNEKKIRQHKEKHTIWKLESLINFGLNGEKLNRKQLIKYLPQLQIDPQKRNFLNFLLQNPPLDQDLQTAEAADLRNQKKINVELKKSRSR